VEILKTSTKRLTPSGVCRPIFMDTRAGIIKNLNFVGWFFSVTTVFYTSFYHDAVIFDPFNVESRDRKKFFKAFCSSLDFS
jgi:hypothetical protein